MGHWIMRIALIANPFSGGKNGTKKFPEIKKHLDQHHIKYDIFVTQYHNHALKTAAKILPGRYDAVVSAGGDGTNYQVLNGLIETLGIDNIPPLGILPTGSGNSFAKDLDIHTIKDGIRVLTGGTIRPVDVCSFTQGEKRHYFVNLMGFGFVTDVARTAHKFKFLGDFSYILGILWQTMRLDFHEMNLEIDGTQISGRNCFVEFCNSRYTGGNMLMAPDAQIDDGLMDIVVAGPLTRTNLLSTLPKIFSGTHGQNPAVRFFKAKEAVIRTKPVKTLLPDGEITGVTPTTIRIHPGKLRYFC